MRSIPVTAAAVLLALIFSLGAGGALYGEMHIGELLDHRLLWVALVYGVLALLWAAIAVSSWRRDVALRLLAITAAATLTTVGVDVASWKSWQLEPVELAEPVAIALLVAMVLRYRPRRTSAHPFSGGLTNRANHL